MPKNVMKLLKPSPNHGRNDFDLSHRHLFPANFGELIPGTCIETVPGDKISLRVSDLVRAQPMVTSPYLRAKQHVDVWFVPYNLMWSRFNEFIVDKDEPNSSNVRSRLYIPHTDLDSLANALHTFGSTFSDVHSKKTVNLVARNLDLLGLCGSLIDGYNQGDLQYANKKVNLWRLLAYNLIWYREYRQQYYDDGKYLLPSSMANTAAGAAFLFNMDFLACDTVQNSFLDGANADLLQLLVAMIQPRYRTWKKDLFTGLMPSSQFGNVSLVNSAQSSQSLVKTNSNITTSFAALEAQRASSYILSVRQTGGQPSNLFVNDVATSFDILALRKSEAIQKWRERSLLAGNQVQDNFEAHYGVKPASHMDVHPRHVASFDAPLNIGDVNATADTGVGDNRYVGDVAGKGIMSFDGSQEIRFETSDFGVMMVIYSILPEAEYNSNGIDRMNALLEREDYFFTEYENLGLEAVDKSVITDNTNGTGVIGYAPRYFGYKQKLDRVCGQFQSFQGYNGQFSPWASPKFDVDDIAAGNPIPLSTLYVNPAVFNNNFHVAFDVVDQFLVDFYCDVEAIRQMSVSGMPGY